MSVPKVKKKDYFKAKQLFVFVKYIINEPKEMYLLFTLKDLKYVYKYSVQHK